MFGILRWITQKMQRKMCETSSLHHHENGTTKKNAQCTVYSVRGMYDTRTRAIQVWSVGTCQSINAVRQCADSTTNGMFHWWKLWSKPSVCFVLANKYQSIRFAIVRNSSKKCTWNKPFWNYFHLFTNVFTSRSFHSLKTFATREWKCTLSYEVRNFGFLS